MPEALRTRLRLTPDDVLPTSDFELNSATDAMSAFEQICLAIPASGAIIAVRDASGLRSVGSLGDAPEVGSHLPPDFGMAIECLQSRSAVFRDLTDDAQRVLSVGLSMEGVSQVRSAVTLPMHASGAIIGLIAVFSRHESSIQPRDIKDLTRVADFWGPLMADEWFPEGIPPAIVEEAAANAAANSTVAEAPIVESLPTKGSESAVEKSEIPDEVASAENTAPAQASTEIEPGVSSAIASTVIDSELPSTNAPMEREESIATTAELTGASKLSHQISPSNHSPSHALPENQHRQYSSLPPNPFPRKPFTPASRKVSRGSSCFSSSPFCCFPYFSSALTGNNPTPR